MVTVAPVACTGRGGGVESRALKSQLKVRAPVHPGQDAVAVNFNGEPGTSGFGEKVQLAAKFRVAPAMKL